MTSREHLIHDLEASLSPHADWFAAQLFRLIAKADKDNLMALWQGFPREVGLWHEFKTDSAQLFREIHQETEKYADMEHDIAQDEREMQFDEEDL